MKDPFNDFIRQVSCDSEEVPSESRDGRTRPTQGRGRNHPRVLVPERSHTLHSHREEGFLPLWIKWYFLLVSMILTFIYQ